MCGRKIVLKAVDDGFENARYRSAVVALEPSILGIAGGLPSGDGGGVDVLAAKNIPGVWTANADAAQAAPTVFDINPPYANVNATTAKFKYLYEQGVRTAALVYIDVAQVKTQVAQQKAQMQAVGIKIVSEQAVPLSTLSYDAAARGVANSKADYVFYPAGGNLNASLARSMADTGYKPKFGEYLTAYGSNFIELAGAAAEGAVNWIRAVPNEETGTNRRPRLRRVDGPRRARRPRRHLRGRRWAAAKAFLDAVEAMPGPITRDGAHRAAADDDPLRRRRASTVRSTSARSRASAASSSCGSSTASGCGSPRQQGFLCREPSDGSPRCTTCSKRPRRGGRHRAPVAARAARRPGRLRPHRGPPRRRHRRAARAASPPSSAPTAPASPPPLWVMSGLLTPTSGCRHVDGPPPQQRAGRRSGPARDLPRPRGPVGVPEPHRGRQPRRGVRRRRLARPPP